MIYAPRPSDYINIHYWYNQLNSASRLLNRMVMETPHEKLSTPRGMIYEELQTAVNHVAQSIGYVKTGNRRTSLRGDSHPMEQLYYRMSKCSGLSNLVREHSSKPRLALQNIAHMEVWNTRDGEFQYMMIWDNSLSCEPRLFREFCERGLIEINPNVKHRKAYRLTAKGEKQLTHRYTPTASYPK